MHLHGLKFLIALLLIIGEILDASTDSSTSNLLNKVADFDNIVERHNDDMHSSISGRESTTDGKLSLRSSSLRSAKLAPFIRPRLRTKVKTHDIRNRESKTFSNNKIVAFGDVSNSNDNSVSGEVVIQPHYSRRRYKSAQPYMVRDHFPENGYFIVKEQNPSIASLEKPPEKIQRGTETQQKEDMDPLFEENMERSVGEEQAESTDENQGSTATCTQVGKLLEELLNSLLTRKVVISDNDEPVEVIVHKVEPHGNSKVHLLSNPESIRCIQSLLDKRQFHDSSEAEEDTTDSGSNCEDVDKLLQQLLEHMVLNKILHDQKMKSREMSRNSGSTNILSHPESIRCIQKLLSRQKRQAVLELQKLENQPRLHKYTETEKNEKDEDVGKPYDDYGEHRAEGQTEPTGVETPPSKCNGVGQILQDLLDNLAKNRVITDPAGKNKATFAHKAEPSYETISLLSKPEGIRCVERILNKQRFLRSPAEESSTEQPCEETEKLLRHLLNQLAVNKVLNDQKLKNSKGITDDLPRSYRSADILRKPESIRCIQKLIRRQKRHTSAANLERLQKLVYRNAETEKNEEETKKTDEDEEEIDKQFVNKSIEEEHSHTPGEGVSTSNCNEVSKLLENLLNNLVTSKGSTDHKEEPTQSVAPRAPTHVKLNFLSKPQSVSCIESLLKKRQFFESPEPEPESTTDSASHCKEVDKLLQQLLDHLVTNKILHNPKNNKYTARETPRRYRHTNSFNKEQFLRCLKKFLGRQKRHATYVTQRRKPNRFNRHYKRKRRDIPDTYKEIMEFITKNKTFDEGYTVVPIVFATESSDLVAPSPECTASSNIPAFTAAPETSQSTMVQAINNLATAESNPNDEMKFRVPNTNGSSNTVKVLRKQTIQEAQNLLEELSFRVPQLRRSFVKIMSSQESEPTVVSNKQERDAPANASSEAATDTTSTEAATDGTISTDATTDGTSNSTDSSGGTTELNMFTDILEDNKRDAMNTTDKNLAPGCSGTATTDILNFIAGLEDFSPPTTEKMVAGVLIYPKNKTKRKRDTLGLSSEDVANDDIFIGVTDVAEAPYFDLIRPTLDDNYLDENPRLRHECVDVYCKNETDAILDVLDSIDVSEMSGEAETPITFDPPETVNNKTLGECKNYCAETLPLCMTEPENMVKLDNELLTGVDLKSLKSLNKVRQLPNDEIAAANPNIPFNFESLSTLFPFGNKFATTSRVEKRTTRNRRLNVNRARDVSEKIKKLESDLRLVNEVQDILDGMTEERRKVKKRDALEYFDNDQTTKLFELDLKVVKPLSDDQRRVSSLGKILGWKSRQNEECRSRREASKLRKRKKRKKARSNRRNRRFLAERFQNFS